MTVSNRRIVRCLAGIGIAAAALVGGLAGTAAAAPATPSGAQATPPAVQATPPAVQATPPGARATPPAAQATPPAAAQAAAAPVTYTETSLNLGKRLTVTNAGAIIAAPPAAGDFGQRWVEPSRSVVVGGVYKYGYELRPSSDYANPGKCITDMGANQRVQLTNCNGAPTQVWQWVFRRTVNNLNYQFWINAQTGHKLMFDTFTNEGPLSSFTVIASNKTFNFGTAGEACQLWTD